MLFSLICFNITYTKKGMIKYQSNNFLLCLKNNTKYLIGIEKL